MECSLGSDDAQSASATQSLFAHLLAFFTSSMIGSMSDARGRKGFLVVGLALSLSGPALLVAIQVNHSLNPFWYYASGCVSGIISWGAISLSCLSDVVPPQWRAPSYGVLLAGLFAGFALSPLIVIPLGRFHVSVFSLVLSVACFLYVVIFVPETLPVEVSGEALRRRKRESSGVIRVFVRPLRELSILNRNHLFRLLSMLAFLSGVIGAADQTLFLYYIENRFGFNDKDLALLLFLGGVLGIYVQVSLLKTLNERLGERCVLIIGFLGGAMQNVVYGLARYKWNIYAAFVFGPLHSMTFPVISAIKSNNVDKLEQGRIQGALSSLQSLSQALGPAVLNHVYKETKDWGYPGPGLMFLLAATLYLVAVVISTLLPAEQTDSKTIETNSSAYMQNLNQNDNSRTSKFESTLMQ